MTTKPKLERFLKIPHGVTHGAAACGREKSLKSAFLLAGGQGRGA